MKNYLFTSESVTEGHPDKLCDQISDAVLDAYLAHDPNARVACETAAASGIIMIMGEATSMHEPDIVAIARNTLRATGYGDLRFGFDAERVPMLVKLKQGFGRLIRTETDTGVVALLDSRARTGAAYHDCVIASLPDCRTTSRIEDVQEFLKRKKSSNFFDPAELQK